MATVTTVVWLALWLVTAAPSPRAPEREVPPVGLRALGLPKERLDKIDALTLRANEELRPLEAALLAARGALDAELAADNSDEKTVTKLIDDVTRAESAVRKNRILLMVRVRAILGPDAWRKLNPMTARGAPLRPPPCGPDRTCAPGLVCCPEPLQCANRCVQDCRHRPQDECRAVDGQCSQEDGVCVPPGWTSPQVPTSGAARE